MSWGVKSLPEIANLYVIPYMWELDHYLRQQTYMLFHVWGVRSLRETANLHVIPCLGELVQQLRQQIHMLFHV